jgi:chitinase
MVRRQRCRRQQNRYGQVFFALSLRNNLTTNIGMPLYGRAFEQTAGIRQPFTGIGTGTWEAGVYDYKALPIAGAQVIENATLGASYSYDSSKKELVSYDTPNIIRQKAAYIKSKGLAGGRWYLFEILT